MRLTIYDAPAHSDVWLPPGEYEGPFIINRPMRLIGQGNTPAAVTLWARHAPVVIVRSPDVVLMNLRIETTYAPEPPLWYETNCRPDSRQAEIIGNEVAMDSAQQQDGWLLPNLIDLGDLPANQAVKLPLTITVPAPAHLTEELVGLHLNPNQLATPGQHLIQLSLAADKLARDTMVAGQIIIRTANESRTLWVIGRVTDQTAWAYHKLILVSQSGHKYAFGETTILGQAQFRHELEAKELTPQQAHLHHEPQGVWTIIQPLPVTVATRINGQLLGIGHRRLLKTGELIELGSLKLRVETEHTDLPLTVQREIDLGKLGQTPKLHYLTIKNEHRISLWRGTLRSTVDWLTVPASHVSCLGGQTTQIPLQLSPTTQALPPQKLHQLGALVLSGINESWFINVSLEIEELAPNLTLEPTMLDWGEVSAWQQSQPQTIRLHNASLKAWTGRINVHVPWLEVRPSQLVCPPQGEVTAQVYLTQAVENLAIGQTKTAAALSLSDGNNATISLTARLTLAPPQLEVIPKQVALTISDNATMPRTVIRVRNMGGQQWSGTVRSTLPWLEVAPAQLICPPHREAPLEIWLNSQARRIFSQSRAPLQIDDALEITGMGLLLQVGCRVTVNFTPPSIPPLTQGGAGGGSLTQGEAGRGSLNLVGTGTGSLSLGGAGKSSPIQGGLIDFGFINLKNPASWPNQEIRLVNHRPWSVEGRAQSMLPWLELTPHQFTHPSGQEIVFHVRLTPAAIKLNLPYYDVPQAIVIQSGDQRQVFRVHLTLEQANTPPSIPPLTQGGVGGSSLTVDKLALDFGTIQANRSFVALPTQTVQIKNGLTRQSVSFTIRSTVPWLSVTTDNMTCLPQQTMPLTVQLTSAARALRPKIYDVSDALIIQSGEQKILLSARVEVSRA